MDVGIEKIRQDLLVLQGALEAHASVVKRVLAEVAKLDREGTRQREYVQTERAQQAYKAACMLDDLELRRQSELIGQELQKIRVRADERRELAKQKSPDRGTPPGPAHGLRGHSVGSTYPAVIVGYSIPGKANFYRVEFAGMRSAPLGTRDAQTLAEFIGSAYRDFGWDAAKATFAIRFAERPDHV